MEIVLGIETSCDDTGVAVYHGQKGLLAHYRHSQIETHAPYGGVVPELASRDHIQHTLPLIQAVLEKAQVSKHDLDGIAYTAGPGLIGALFVGAALGRSLGFALGIPTIGVNHMEGHLLAPMLEADKPDYPFIALLVSGGHTQLVHVEGFGQYQVIGTTLDDAAGEAFDKTAKLLGLGYPGGPCIAKCAEQGGPSDIQFPRPMCQRPGLAFSFSGLKTAVRQEYEKSDKTARAKANIAYAFQEAVVDTLIKKCERALEQTGENRLVISGGVSANALLRNRLQDRAKQKHYQVYYPSLEFCTDNGAMIAYCGYLHLLQGECDELIIKAKARMPLA